MTDFEELAAAVKSHFAGGPIPEDIATAMVDLTDTPYLNSTDREKAEMELDPLTNDDHRAVVAENMLNQYHLLKTNLATRQAIYHTICARQQAAAIPGASAAVDQAQAELNQCKYEILELMGVDS